MLSYSPYDNSEAASYPAMLVKTSLNDSQVMYWEPAKYVAKLRTLKTDNEPAAAADQHASRPRRRQRPLRLPQEIAFDYAISCCFKIDFYAQLGGAMEALYVVPDE
jgi:oligopeptidase B